MTEIPIHGTPEQIAAYCKSMHAMQGTFGSVPKNAEGKVGKTGDLRTFKFTNFDCLVEYLRPFLFEHGFFHFANPGSVIQKFAGSEGEAISTVATGAVVLHHVDGARCVAEYSMTVPSPRDAGIVHTYCKRYALQGLVGISSDDDTDAEGIQNTPPQQAQKARQEPPRQQSKAQQTPAPSDREKAKARAARQMDQLKELLESRAGSKDEEDDFKELVAKHSKDAHGDVPSVLARKVEVYKLDEVLRWADENIGQKPIIRDEGFEDGR